VADTERPTKEASTVPIVELTVYAGDSVAFGRLALTADRVTDLMNERTEFEFVDTYLHSLDDSHGLQVRTVVWRETRSSPSRSVVRVAILRAGPGLARSRSSCGLAGTTSVGTSTWCPAPTRSWASAAGG
jgi:hypothetical protein